MDGAVGGTRYLPLRATSYVGSLWADRATTLSGQQDFCYHLVVSDPTLLCFSASEHEVVAKVRLTAKGGR